jgi:hypothetical protein
MQSPTRLRRYKNAFQAFLSGISIKSATEKTEKRKKQ